MIVRAIRRCAEAIAAEGATQIEIRQTAFEILNLTRRLDRLFSKVRKEL
jgi:hypothetical protein